jgi:hypothetical protein
MTRLAVSLVISEEARNVMNSADGRVIHDRTRVIEVKSIVEKVRVNDANRQTPRHPA